MSPLDQSNPTSDWQSLEEAKAKSKTLRWLVISIVVVILGTASFLYYYFFVKKQTPSATVTTTSKTSDWLTYENKVYGYSIKYNKTFKLDDSDDADAKFLSNVQSDPTLAVPQKSYFEVKCSTSESTSYQDWFNELSLKSPKNQTFLLGGKTGEMITQDGKEQIFLIADSVRYQIIQEDSSDADFLTAVKTFVLIARTKSSAPAASSPEVVLPQTYTNEAYFYLIKYPSNWMVTAVGATGSVLDEEDFQNLDSGQVLFYIKVTNRTLIYEINAYKSSLNGETIISETPAKIVSSKGGLENTATFLTKNNHTYILWGKSKDSQYQLYYDMMVSSMEFTK